MCFEANTVDMFEASILHLHFVSHEKKHCFASKQLNIRLCEPHVMRKYVLQVCGNLWYYTILSCKFLKPYNNITLSHHPVVRKKNRLREITLHKAGASVSTTNRTTCWKAI
jgi:hypothetical protein